ncbi:FHA domain-containing protein [Acaryochloris marina]|uniref:FHA domain containing protein n=1 Tax=Acaryochloris marina (strain MBIC 11017) TaxID=329726 RepID=A8ZKC3_ACAM1|nr:FHA domain-containing protein [Acaryochloris marina]ABW31623.1 FHA domain containing protein [Acaryochloris marina MBIC11017]
MEKIKSEACEHHLLVIDDGKERRIVKLTEVAYSIGRDATNAIVLNNPSISRQHAMLVRVPLPHQAHRYRIIDGNSQGKPSANGIYINGQPSSTRELETKDLINFGKDIKATYLTLEMGQVELLNYIESLSYKSLKSDTLDHKATVFNSATGTLAELNTVLACHHSPTPEQDHDSLQQTPLQAKETVRLSREEILKELNKPVSRQMWMVIAGAILSFCTLIGWLMLDARKSSPALEFTQAPSSLGDARL